MRVLSSDRLLVLVCSLLMLGSSVQAAQKPAQAVAPPLQRDLQTHIICTVFKQFKGRGRSCYPWCVAHP